MAKLTFPHVPTLTGQARVLRWRCREGQRVSAGDVLLEVDSDQGLIEIQSPRDATFVQWLTQPGARVGAGTVLGELSDLGVATSSAPDVTKPIKKESAVSSSSSHGPVIPVLMPQAGQSMEEGTIVKWHVKPGDRIAKGQVIFEIETDKATMDVEAVDEGRLARIVVSEGQTCPVKQPVGYLAEQDSDVDAFLASGAEPSPITHPPSPEPVTTPPSAQTVERSAPKAVPDGSRIKASPVARRMAAERGVELGDLVPGSGPGGRVLSTDVLAAQPKPSPQPAAFTKPQAQPVEGVTRKRMSQMRKAIARNLLLSKQTIPHFYLKQKIDASALYSFYQGEKAKYPLSINDIVVAACARALMEFPAFRSRIEGEEIVTFPSANIGIAVGMDDGLVVPVVINAQTRTLQQLGQETKRLASNARSGRIEGMGQGVFTITNLGMFGIEEFIGIINPPEAGILAVGAIKEEVIVSGGTFKAGRVMTMVLSADHRVVDGVLAAKFMNRLKELLEWPGQMA